MLRITSSGLPGPHPSAPRGSLLFRCAPEPSQPLASRRDCHDSGIRVSFFVRSGYRATSLCSDAPKTSSLPIASGASQTTAARRLLCPCGLSYLFFVPVPANFASLRLPWRCYRSGRRDPCSASLRTGHGFPCAPSPSRPLTRTPGRRTVSPYGRTARTGAPPQSCILLWRVNPPAPRSDIPQLNFIIAVTWQNLF